MGFWDHWVPDANKASTALVNEWAEKEKVEVSIDYITSQGNKNLLTIASEGQAKSGHDILAMPTWWPHANSDLLEPVNDIMEPLIKQNGEVNGTVKYLGQLDGKWLGVPACIGSQIKGPCSRIDLMKKYANIDVQEMYPAGAMPRRLRSNAGPMASRPDRKADLRHSCPTSGPRGISPGTRKPQRACWCTCRNRHRSRSWWQPVAAMTCRRSRNLRP